MLEIDASWFLSANWQNSLRIFKTEAITSFLRWAVVIVYLCEVKDSVLWNWTIQYMLRVPYNTLTGNTWNSAVLSVYSIKSYLTCKELALIWGRCCSLSSFKSGSRILCSCKCNLHNKYIWPISPSFDNSIHCLKIKQPHINRAQLKRQEKDRSRLATHGW